MAQEKFRAITETQAINFHGTFFKKAVRDILEEIPGMSIREEYPVLYEKDASIDLLATYHVDKFKQFIPIECKRALPSAKHWLFFPISHGLTTRDAQAINRIDGFGKSTKIGVTTTPILINSVCIEGMEIENEGGTFRANPSPIWDAAEQISRNYTGFVLQERDERQRTTYDDGPDPVAMFPMIITTAKLYIAKYDATKIHLEDGNYPIDIEKQEVPFLSLNHPFIPQRNGVAIFDTVLPSNVSPLAGSSREYDNPWMRESFHKQSIVVVNAMHLKEFFAAYLASTQAGNPQAK